VGDWTKKGSAMKRKLNSYEESYWANPLKDINPDSRPYLSDIIWPDDPRSKVWDEAEEILKRFYCTDREKGNESTNQLRDYLSCPEKYMIVWGEVGIGKSWFMRYELVAGDNSMKNANPPYQAGIIDMLRGVDVEYHVFKQLKPILELYFERFYGGTKRALEEYLKFDYARFIMKKPENFLNSDEYEVQFILKKWLSLRNDLSAAGTKEYIMRLLDALQFIDRDELLILLVDNIDKNNDEGQEELVKLSVRLLRHPKIRLIIPLRKSSKLFGDRFSVLKEFSYQEMILTPVNIRNMLRLRFLNAKNGKSLRGNPKFIDSHRNEISYTFPQIFTMLFGKSEDTITEAGDLLITMAGSNARESLALTEKLIYSDQLKGFRNLHDPEYAVAGLMLSDTSEPEVTHSCMLNLFNNEEPEEIGNELIRFRVLEYFWNSSRVTISENRFAQYFERLGYEIDRILEVLELFLMTQIIISVSGFSLEEIRKRLFENIETLAITQSGRELRNIIDRIWYWVTVKKDAYFPQHPYIQNDKGREYITHTSLVEWLKEAEIREQRKIESYEKINGRLNLDWDLLKPHLIAEKALKGEVEE
jgi:hypothetical protein